MPKRLRHVGALVASDVNSAFNDVAGAYMDYDAANNLARFGASATAGGSKGFKIRSINTGTPVDAIVSDAAGNVTIANLTVTSLTFTGALSVSSLTSSGAITSTGNFTVGASKLVVTAASGNTTIAGTLGVTGDVAINTNKFTVTALSGNTLVAGTLNVTSDFKINTNKFITIAATGNTTIAGTLGLTGDFAINTNKFTVTAASGNTLVAGTLGVTGTLSAGGDLAINTNKFTVTAASGNTLVAGTLTVNGQFTLALAAATITVNATTGNPALVFQKVGVQQGGWQMTALSTMSFIDNGGAAVATFTGSSLAFAGNLTINVNKFTVTGSNGNTLIAGTLDVTSDLKINTNKLVVTASTGALVSKDLVEAAGALISANGTSGILRARKTDTSLTTLLSYDEATDKITIPKSILATGIPAVTVLPSDTTIVTPFATAGLSKSLAVGQYLVQWRLEIGSVAGNTGGYDVRITFPAASLLLANGWTWTTSGTIVASGSKSTTSPVAMWNGVGLRDASSIPSPLYLDVIITVTSPGTIDLQIQELTPANTYAVLAGSFVIVTPLS